MPHTVTLVLTKEKHDRLIRAFIADTALVTKQTTTFPEWAERILFDWVNTVEEETKTSNRNN